MVVIGDEILSGRTRDSNLHHLANALTDHGIALIEARIVADVHDTIRDTVAELAGRFDHVFTSGGIGPTHDDITADAVAAAMGAAIDVRADAKAILQDHYDAMGTELNAARLRMARIPDGARLIDNPISAAPGFSLGNVHVMAGIPQIFEAMLAGLLPSLTGGAPVLSQSLRVLRGEGDIATILAEIATAHPEVSIGSYPFHQNGLHGSNVVVRSQDGAAVDRVMTELNARLADEGS
jgi:molybdenum cofactor synthesis domain-containing protein